MDLTEATLIIPAAIEKDASFDSFSKIVTYGSQNGASIESGKELLLALEATNTKYAIIVKEPLLPDFSNSDFSEIFAPLISNETALSYSNFGRKVNNEIQEIHLINYQEGSVRDDFDFGPVIALNVERAKESIKQIDKFSSLKYSALYALRLAISTYGLPIHITKRLYTTSLLQRNLEYESQFAYVDSKNREAQIELEETFTAYSKLAGIFLPPRTKQYISSGKDFAVKASVIIPVRDRVKTVGEAVKSALSQNTNFTFNIIVVDNHSTDGTSELLASIAKEDPRLIHIQPEENNLLIGGCWNKGIDSKACGEYVVQLDSDDLYSSDMTLQRIIDQFNIDKSAAVIGSYQLVNFELKEIPPGLIDHKEWTDSNGHNNAIRIHGLGAPRAIATEVARKVRFENVSYGEDYAMMLAVCRDYKISRIYDSLYLCRRWDGNSDAHLPMDKKNRNNSYKDSIRTKEILARRKLASIKEQ